MIIWSRRELVKKERDMVSVEGIVDTSGTPRRVVVKMSGMILLKLEGLYGNNISFLKENNEKNIFDIDKSTYYFYRRKVRYLIS